MMLKLIQKIPENKIYNHQKDNMEEKNPRKQLDSTLNQHGGVPFHRVAVLK